MSSEKTGAGDEPIWVGDVLRFWLEQTSPEARFGKSASLDADISARFSDLFETLERNPPHPDRLTPRLALAAIIVLDQFSRNMYRGTPRAFSADAVALALAKATVAAGLDRDLSPEGRLFIYLPFEHSEKLADQEAAISLIEPLGNARWTSYAISHRDIIQRFGRFPHRNDILGRSSSDEELEFLKQPGSSF